MIENILNSKANIDISIPKETVSFVRKKSEDNPFYIEQIILYLQKNNLLDLEFSLKDKDFEIPSSINSIIIARIDRLKNDLKKVIQTASVLGKEFNIKVLSGMFNNKDIEKELKEGKKENIWSVLSELSYLFKHALISESVYEMQLKKQLRELHKLAAETFEKLFSDEIDRYYFDIAKHYDKAESIEKAIDYLFKAGVQAQNEYKNEQAVDLYDRLLKLIKRKKIKKDLLVVGVLINKGTVHQIVGEWVSARKCFQEALKLSTKIKNKSKISESLKSLGWQNYLYGEFDEAMKCFERDLELSKELENENSICLTFRTIGIILEAKGDNSNAMKFYNQSFELSERLKNKRGISLAIGNKGNIYKNKGNYTKALELLSMQYELAQELDDTRILCTAIGNMGTVYDRAGNYELAMECYEKVMNHSEKLGDRFLKSTALCNIGVILEDKGEYESAMDHYSKSLKTLLH